MTHFQKLLREAKKADIHAFRNCITPSRMDAYSELKCSVMVERQLRRIKGNHTYTTRSKPSQMHIRNGR